MAKITHPPALEVVDFFRGTLDFYKWCDLNIVRSWPRWPKRKPYPRELVAQQRFAYITRAWTALDPYLKERYDRTARGTDYTARDLFTRLYLRGLAP